MSTVSSSARSRLALRVYGALLAATALPMLAGWLAIYPLNQALAGGLLAAYGGVILVWPNLWLLILPALWPVIDLAPWTGQIHFTESDALALATLSALGLREALMPPPATNVDAAPVQLRVVALGLFGLLGLSVALSGWHGLGGIPRSFDPAALVGYETPYNALRVGKGFVFAFALIPFLHKAIRRGGEVILNRFCAGIALGLLSCALAALWERLAFTSLTDFASEYRSAALFWEMHVGGAALDAWLVMTFPFAVYFVGHRHAGHTRALALVGTALGAYALFTTFSRVVIVAVFASALALGVQSLCGPRDGRVGPRAHWGFTALLLLAALAGLHLSFSGGGYRGLAAFAGLVLVSYMGGGAVMGMRRGQVLAGAAAGLGLTVFTVLATQWLPKGVYLSYALSFLAAAGVLLVGERRGIPPAPPLVLALLVWTAINAALVGLYWGEAAAMPGSPLAAALGLLALAGQVLAPRPLWQPRTRNVPALGVMLITGGMLVVTLGSFFMGERLAGSNEDYGVRTQHYERSFNLLDRQHRIFGLGLGHYPEAYFWNAPMPGAPGYLRLVRSAEGTYMRLGAARKPDGNSDRLRLCQRVDTDVTGPIHYRIKARTDREIHLSLDVCRKNLLYADGCAQTYFMLKPGDWQVVEGSSGKDAVAGPGWPPRFANVSLNQWSFAEVDLAEVEVFDSRGQSLIRNGDFSRDGQFWFFSSDRDHLPWHAKNLWLHAYVEQGWLGVIAFTLLLGAALIRLLRAPARLHPCSRPLLASLAGLACVAMVDSLADVPRLMVFMLLLLWLALSLRPQPQQATNSANSAPGAN